MKLRIILLLTLLFQLSYGQTEMDCECDHVITTPNQNFPNSANITVCLQGDFEYNQNITLKNNVQLCIGEGIVMNGNISAQNWATDVVVKNFGIISGSGIINANMVNSIIHNYGVFERNINFNQGGNKEFYNYGTFTTNSSSLSSGTLINYSNATLNLTSATQLNSNFNFENQSVVNVDGAFAINKHGQQINAIINTNKFVSNNGVVVENATINSDETPVFNGTNLIKHAQISTSGDFTINNSTALEGACVSLEGNAVLNGLNFFEETTLDAQGFVTVNNGIRMINSSLQANTSTTLNGTIRLTNSLISTEEHLTMNNIVQTGNNNNCSSLIYNSINNWHGQMQSNFGDLKISQFASSYNSSNIQGNVSVGQCELDFSNDCGFFGNDEDDDLVFIWEGSQNFKWDNTSNWNINQVPSPTDKIIISSTANQYPKLEFDVEVGDVFFEDNSFLDLNDYTFTANGTIRGNGTIKSTDLSSLVINGEGESELYFDEVNNEIYDLTINNPQSIVELETELFLYHILAVDDGEFHTNDLLTLECTFANSGPFAEVITTAQVSQLGGEIVGDITVVQCYSGKRAFRFVASTVDTETSIRENWQENSNAWDHNPNPGYGTHITGTGVASANPEGLDGLNGFDWQPSGKPSMFTFDNQNTSWNPVEGTTGTLEVGKPYRLMIRGNRGTNVTSNAAQPSQTKLRATGKIHKGEFVLNVGNLDLNSFVFFANPFQSDVDMSQVIADSDNVRPFFYIWDTSLNKRGSFAVINAVAPNDLAPEDSNISKFTLPQQAGFLLASGDGEVVIRFKEEHKTPFIKQVATFSTSNQPRINVQLYNNEIDNSKSSDGLRINFFENDSPSLEDAQKNENIDENIAVLDGNELLALQNRILPTDGEVVQLFTNKYQVEDYSLKVDVFEMDGYDVFLRDNYTNTLHQLNSGENEMSFHVDQNINASKAFNRFQLEFEQVPLNVNEFTEVDFSVYPNPVKGDFVTVKSTSLINLDAVVNVFDVQGRKLKSLQVNFNDAGETKIDTYFMNKGVYLLKLESASYSKVVKLIKE